MPVKYKFERIYRKKFIAEGQKKNLERQGYKVRLIKERLRDGIVQYVLYRSREKTK